MPYFGLFFLPFVCFFSPAYTKSFDFNAFSSFVTLFPFPEVFAVGCQFCQCFCMEERLFFPCLGGVEPFFFFWILWSSSCLTRLQSGHHP